MADKKAPKYLVKDREVRLYKGDDVDAARQNGWSEPEGTRSNGEPYNPEPEDGEVNVVEAKAEIAQRNAEVKARRDAKKAKDNPPVESSPVRPSADFRVEIIEPEAEKPAAKKAAAKKSSKK